MAEARYLTAEQASTLLDITPATLYAYVSRGLIRSEAVAGDSRARRYSAEDVRKLKERKEQRRNPARVVQSALHWGAPVLESALTLITEHGVYYRGYDALALATTHRFEDVATLLWTGSFAAAADLFGPDAPDLIVPAPLDTLAGEIDPISRWVIALALAGPRDLAAYTVQPEAGTQAGARILALMTTTLLSGTVPGASIAERLGAGWTGGSPAATKLLNAALVLCADHELNASSFVARVVASAESSLYNVVIAGLAALQGFRHGGNTLRVEALLREIGTQDRVERVLAERLRRGERIPGFGQKLYPDGDPRGQRLLALLAEAYPDAAPVRLAAALSAAAEPLIRRRPNVDFAVAVLGQTLELPPGGALALFALGRTAGWIGHALEQWTQGDMIRPRAAYIGPPIHP